MCHIAIICMTLRLHTTDYTSMGGCLQICGYHTHTYDATLYGATGTQGHILLSMVTVDTGSAMSRCGCRTHRDIKC